MRDAERTGWETMRVEVLSGGAAQGLVAALEAQFKAETGCDIAGTFGAVGAMRDKLLAGAPRRSADPDLRPDCRARALGSCGRRLCRRRRRRARPASPCAPAIQRLRSATLMSCAPPCSRQTPSTSPTRSRRRPASTSPRRSNGWASAGMWPPACSPIPTAPRQCARWRSRRAARPIGCTQVTEILATPGVTLVGPLPEGLRARHRLHRRRLHEGGAARRGRAPRRAPQL